MELSNDSIKDKVYGTNNKDIMNEGEPHLPAVLVIDTSFSMAGVKNQLRQAMIDFGKAIQDDERAVGTVETMIITFDSEARVIEPFGSAYDFAVPDFECSGMTAMHEAVDLSLEEIQARKKQYSDLNMNWYRPWIFMITDGKPNDEDTGAFERLLQSQKDKHCIFYPVALDESADKKLLGSLREDHKVLTASKDNFAGVFKWMSNSVVSASNSRTGEDVDLENPEDYGIGTEQIVLN